MKLPSRVHIGPYDYTLAEVVGLHIDAKKLDGHIDHGNLLIQVEQGLSDQVKLVTLLHEMIHGIRVVTGSSQVHDEPELIVEVLSHGLLALMRDNPGLIPPYLCVFGVSIGSESEDSTL